MLSRLIIFLITYITFIVGYASAQHCCVYLEFFPVSEDLVTSCFEDSEKKFGGIIGVAEIPGARIAQTQEKLYSLDSDDFGCFHGLDLGENVSISEAFVPEIQKWVITLTGNGKVEHRDTLSIGNEFIQINRRR